MNFDKNEQEILIMIISNHGGQRNLQDLMGRTALIEQVRTGTVEGNVLEVLQKIFAEAQNLPTDPVAMPLVLSLAKKMGVIQVTPPVKQSSPPKDNLGDLNTTIFGDKVEKNEDEKTEED